MWAKLLCFHAFFAVVCVAFDLNSANSIRYTCGRHDHSIASGLHAAEKDAAQCEISSELDPDIAGQFKIVTCSSTACAKRSKAFGLDEYALYSGIYERKELNDATRGIEVEEGSCMGRCKFAPCIGVEHEDFDGKVGLEGMTDEEIQSRVFQNIVTEDDLDRVWSSVENAIRVMAEEEEAEY